MAVETRADTLKIVREADGLEVDLQSLQGLWTEAQYLKLTDQTNHRIEFTDGVIEVLSMPTDILLVRDANDPRRQNAFWLGADLVIEIVSPDRPERDTDEKRLDYAEAGIPEYWIVNPLDETVTVLNLEHDTYTKQSVFRRGDTATSTVLHGFAVRVDEAFDAE